MCVRVLLASDEDEAHGIDIRERVANISMSNGCAHANDRGNEMRWRSPRAPVPALRGGGSAQRLQGSWIGVCIENGTASGPNKGGRGEEGGPEASRETRGQRVRRGQLVEISVAEPVG